MQPGPSPVPGPHLDLAPAQEALAGQGEVVGTLQAGLAGTADALLAANKKSISTIKRQLSGRGAAAKQGTQQLAGAIASQLGQTATGAIVPGTTAVQQIGAGAASGFTIPPPGAGNIMIVYWGINGAWRWEFGPQDKGVILNSGAYPDDNFTVQQQSAVGACAGIDPTDTASLAACAYQYMLQIPPGDWIPPSSSNVPIYTRRVPHR